MDGWDLATVWFIHRMRIRSTMAKSDSFFIRASVDFTGTTFNQASVDLGAYVDALGKSVLRIHRLEADYGFELPTGPAAAGPGGITNAFQLTTQSQSQIVDATDRSVIAKGTLYGSTPTGNGNPIDTMSESLNIVPQAWTNGYLVGVEQIYLGCDSTDATAMGISRVSLVLECTVETLSQSGAMALALSQQ